MRLLELDPAWLTPNVLTFRCPHCRKFWLTCKNAVLTEAEQFDLYEKHFGSDWHMLVVPCRGELLLAIQLD